MSVELQIRGTPVAPLGPSGDTRKIASNFTDEDVPVDQVEHILKVQFQERLVRPSVTFDPVAGNPNACFSPSLLTTPIWRGQK